MNKKTVLLVAGVLMLGMATYGIRKMKRKP